MHRNLTVDSRAAGLRNEETVLALLTRYGELSQAQICELGGLSSSTSSYIVRRLREKGLVRERPGERRKGGARPVFLSIRPTGRYVVGVELGPSSARIGLFDFSGHLVDSVRPVLDNDRSPDRVLEVVELNLRGLLSRHSIDVERLLGIGLALSGTVTRDGVVQTAAPLGWKDVPLAGKLEHMFPNVPVRVFTTRVRLLAELDLDRVDAVKNVVLLNFSDGAGTNVIVDGNLLQGSTSRTGELGHVVFEPSGERCGCGNRGCLETLVSGPALARRIVRAIEAGERTSLAAGVNPTMNAHDVIDRWASALADNDEYALTLREFVGAQVSRAASIAVNMFDPELLILAGYVTRACPDYLAARIRNDIPEQVYDGSERSIQIETARAGEESMIRGIALALLKRALGERVV
jgi:predicted NBD/HSP70 family sugar kinase